MNQAATRRQSIIRVLIVTAFILTVPLIAMQFTDEVNWGLGDFIIIGVLLFSTGIVYELKVKKIPTVTHRIIASGALLATLFLIWAELAVGLVEKLLTGR